MLFSTQLVKKQWIARFYFFFIFFSDGLSRLREIHLSNCAYMAASLPINIPDTPPARYWRMDVTDFHEHTATKKRERERKQGKELAPYRRYINEPDMLFPQFLSSPTASSSSSFFFLLLFYVYPGICDDNEIEKRLADDRVGKERKTIEDFRIKILIFCCWVIDKTTAAYMWVEACNNAHRDGEIQPTLSAINRAPLPYIHPLPVTINRARVAAYIYAFDCTLPTSKKQNFAV